MECLQEFAWTQGPPNYAVAMAAAYLGMLTYASGAAKPEGASSAPQAS